jgi:phenylalanine-4-hydroxylase
MVMETPQAPTARNHTLRGRYDAARSDYTVEQRYGDYSFNEHRIWAELLARQRALAARYAVPEFLAGVTTLGLDERIPRLALMSDRLRRLTGWQLVGVPGLIPERAFFAHLARRRFPVTVWIRSRDEFDYLVEPDLFHDLFGHVPLLCDPVYAGFMELYGRAGERAMELGGLEMLARLYWYTIEFGLTETPTGLRAHGAGILSSAAETPYAIDSNVPHRIRFDLQRVLRTGYLIDDLQRCYFVVRDFGELIDACVGTDFAPLYRQLAAAPPITPGALLPGDIVIHRGRPARERRAVR